MKSRTYQAVRAFGNWLDTPRGLIAMSAAIGVIFFVLFYGAAVLDVTNVAWLLRGDDLKQHYLGWVFFRQSSWQLPLGTISGLAYPFGIPVTFLDSIPLAALFFKVFSGILPEHFQYFGWWGLISYALIGVGVALIVRRFTKNVAIILLIVAMIITAPIMLARMFTHTALASQWLLLFAGVLLVYYDKLHIKKALALWSALFVLTMLIHPYFLPMVGIIYAVYLVTITKSWRDIKKHLLYIVPPLLGLLVFWVIGGFSVPGGTSTNELSIYNTNLLSIINPYGWSALLSALPNHSPSQENLGYIGLGMLALLPVAWFSGIGWVQKRNHLHTKAWLSVKSHRVRVIIIAVLLVGYIVFTLGPHIYWGTTLVAEVPTPSAVEKMWAIFRANGRLFWPLYYALCIGLCIVVVHATRRWKPVYGALLLVPFMMLQTVDVLGSRSAIEKRHYIKASSQTEYDPSSFVDQWNRAASGKSHLVTLDPITPQQFFELADVALAYHLTMSDGYFARSPEEKIAAYRDQQRQSILASTNSTFDSMLFVTTDKAFIQQVRDEGTLRVYTIGEYFVIY